MADVTSSALFPEERRVVEQALLAHFARYAEPSEHYGLLKYHFGLPCRELENRPTSETNGGKRLRPIASLLVCRALGAESAAAERLAVAIELIHGASLVHDDVQDEDELRWGRPTLWRIAGGSQAINLGDALIAMGYQALSELREVGVPDDRVLGVLRAFNRANLRMCEGQHLDMAYRLGREVTVTQYLEMVSGKTAAAFECALTSATLVGGRDQASVEQSARFGWCLGMLYQICDDMRAIWVEPFQLDKAAGNDIRQKKLTLPILLGLQANAKGLREMIEGDVDATSSHSLRELARRLTEQGIYAECRGYASKFRSQCKEHLDSLGLNTATKAVLLGLVEFCYEASELPSESHVELATGTTN